MPFPSTDRSPSSSRDSLANRFRETMLRLGFRPSLLPAAAVSGGADSCALALLLREAFPEIPCLILHVDHTLRGEESAEDARHVEALAASLGARFAMERWNREAEPFTGNLHAGARTARYRLLTELCRKHGASYLLTAHHADDQAETLLLRLLRGAGTEGLGGIPERRPLSEGLTLLRPLLSVSAAELRAELTGRGLSWREDPSNASPRYMRTHVRAFLRGLPDAQESIKRLNTAAAALRADAEILHALSRQATAGTEGVRFTSQGEAILPRAVLHDLPAPLLLRVLARLLHRLPHSAPPRAAWVGRMIEALRAGKHASLHGWDARPLPCGGALFTRSVRAAEHTPVTHDRRRVIWDGRFRLTLPPNLPPECTLSPLGHAFPDLKGWRAAIPALGTLDRLLAVPHIAFKDKHKRLSDAARLPCVPLKFRLYSSCSSVPASPGQD